MPQSRTGPVLTTRRANKRRELIAATVAGLEKIKARVESGKLRGAAKIGERIGKVIGKYKVGKYKVGKHIIRTVTDQTFSFAIDEKNVSEEAAVDGIYIIRTSVEKKDMTAEAAVLNYKKLAEVERAFRTSWRSTPPA